MANLAKVLKDEIARISRREVNKVVAPLRAAMASQRKVIASLRRQLLQTEKSTRKVARVALKKAPVQAAAGETSPRMWISGKGIRSLRAKLNVSQAEFAKLAGVTDQSVYNWERKPGKLKLRESTRTVLTELRGIGVREARRRLEVLAAEK